MTEKHNWITDDLCLIEESTGVKLYGTVCTDIRFIAKQLNEANETIRRLEKKNNELAEKVTELNHKLQKYIKENDALRGIDEEKCMTPGGFHGRINITGKKVE